MSRRDRSARAAGPRARGEETGKVVFLPQGIELELVGIIGPEAMGSVFLDGDEDLRALFESLDEAGSGPVECGGPGSDGGFASSDRPLN